MNKYEPLDESVNLGAIFPRKKRGIIRRIAEVIGLAFVASVCLALLWVLFVEAWALSLPNVPVK